MSKRRMVLRKDLKKIYGIPYSATHIDRLEDADEFPHSFKLGNYRGSLVAYWEDEIEAWLTSRPLT